MTSRTDTIEQLHLLDEQHRRLYYNAYKRYKPYPKQKEFHSAGITHTERMMGAANQSGKTLCGAYEASFHATGLYPKAGEHFYPDDWEDEQTRGKDIYSNGWEGARFKRANVGWVGGISGEIIRDSTQKHLVGRMQEPASIGSMAIPKECILDCVRALGVRDLLDHVKVKHISGGTSLIFFKSYEKGRTKFQAESLDWGWCDEEPPPEIYSEMLTRTNNGELGQFMFTTFTPLLGMTTIAHSFYMQPSPAQHLTVMTLDDVYHYTQEEKDAITASYPEHERDARAKGIPILGSGRVFRVPGSSL